MWFFVTICIFLCSVVSITCSGDGWIAFGGSRYLIHANERKSWHDANLTCEQYDSVLASIHSEEENDFICQKAGEIVGSTPPYLWIGFYLVTSTEFAWTDGSVVDFTRWHKGEPNNQHNDEYCTHTTRQGTWNDENCLYVYGYVCRTEISKCFPYPCQNNGVCSEVGDDEYICTCPFGYYGKDCELSDVFVSGQDPCMDYTIIHEQYQRSTSFFGTGNYTRSCDRYISEAVWYRFTGRQGRDIPTQPPQVGSCGTDNPIWIQGTLPVNTESADATACVVTTEDNCSKQYQVQVQNCGDFNVYMLKRTTACNEAYCVGSEVSCPFNQSSPTGYTPGCMYGAVPTLINDPVITPEVVDVGNFVKEVEMQCDIQLNEENVIYDIYWYLDDRLIQKDLGLSVMSATLSENKIKIGSWLKCVVTPKYADSDLVGKSKDASYYMGFEVTSRTLTVIEGGDLAYYEVRPTIPILCSIPGLDIKDCSLPININVPVKSEITANIPTICGDGSEADQITFEAQNCGTSIQATTNLTRKYRIGIAAAIDHIYDADQVLEVNFETIQRFRYHPLWQNVVLPSAQVNVIDKDYQVRSKICKAVDDPHMTTFDGRRYEHQMEGEFILYKHQTLPIEVQAYFKKCSNNQHASVPPTCVCGAAIRSGGDVFIYDHCRPGKPSRIRLYHCTSQGLTVERKGNDKYIVYLPTGTKVELHKSSILIYASVSDWGKTEGLCGTLNGECYDDFLLPSGEYNPVDGGYCNSDYRFYPKEFGHAWRVKIGNSLYKGETPIDTLPENSVYCSCKEDPNNELMTTCGSMGQASVSCVSRDQTDRHTTRCVSRRKRSTDSFGFYDDDVEEEVELFEYDVNYTAPLPEWRDGWTEALAREECTSYITDKPGTQACMQQQVGNVTQAIDSCIEDILLTGNTTFSVVHLDGVLTVCKEEITKNMSFYSYSTSGEEGNETVVLQTPAAILQHVCPADCNQNGGCENGICLCFEGFQGRDCSDEQGKIPDLFEIPNNGLCDQQLRPCGMTPITGDYFIDTENLTCKIKPTKIMEDNSMRLLLEFLITPEYDHSQRVLCPFPVIDLNPDVNTMAIGYNISISNDRIHYSEVKTVLVYDSKCMQCSSGFECYQKPNTCLYRNNCYADGEALAASKYCFICDGATGRMIVDTGTCYIGEECYSEGEQITAGCVCQPEEDMTVCDSGSKLISTAICMWITLLSCIWGHYKPDTA